MTKNEQKIINLFVELHLERALDEYATQHTEYKRLRTCKAEVCETENYYILRSYYTIVAVADKQTGEIYDALRLVYGYTSTSAQHIAKFSQDYGSGARETFRNVN